MNLWLFVIPFAVAAALPGPAQAALLARALQSGGRGSLPFAAGMVAGNAAWLLTAMLGLSALALQFEAAFIAVKWAGVGYLFFVAWQMWTADAATATHGGTGAGGALGGLLLTLGNPKAVVFFGAVLPHAFDMSLLSVPQMLFVLALGVSIDAAVQGAYLWAAARSRAFVASRPKLVNRGAATVIGGSATLIAARG